jgi:hypothetical protein
MVFNFRKIASVVASAVMLGSTVGVAAAATFPAPFVSGGMADVAIVYGSNAAVSDLSSAIDVQTNLQSKTSGSSSSSASSSGGDSVNLATTSQDLYAGSALNAARTVLTKDHLPTLLADGTTYDATGSEFKYTQTVTPGARTVAFGKSGESINPDLIVDVGYQASSSPLYNYTLTFTKTLNVSSTDVIGTAEVSILGKTFTIGANSDSNTLYLYGSGTTVSVDEGETSTVTVDGKDHTVSLIGTSSTTTATIEVDGVRRSMTVGNSYKFADGFEVYFKDIFHATKTGTLSSVDLLVGSKSLHFESGQAVRQGSDDTSILGTNAIVTGTAGNGISQIMVSQSAESSIGDYIKTGQTYTDRVFGNLVFENVGPVPSLDDPSRDMIIVDTDSSVSARVTFTSALADGEEYTLIFARDADNTEDSTLSRVNLAYESTYNISVIENQTTRINEYVVVNDNDEGRVLRVDQIPTGQSTNDYVRLTDIVTGESFDFTTGVNNYTTAARTIGGGEYHAYVVVNSADTALSTVSLTWGASSGPGVPGTQRTLFPRIKLANGQWMAILTEATVENNTVYSVPGEYLLSDYKAGETTAAANGTRTTLTAGNIVYNISWNAQPVGTLDRVTFSGTDCIFNRTLGPAILIMEEKTLASSNGHGICIPLTATSGGSTTEPAVGTPVYSDTSVSASQTLQTDTFKTQRVDTYGTLVERDTSTGTNNKVSISYPDEQMYVDVFFKSADATITPGSGGSAGGGTVMIVKDNEVSSVSGKNLVVIGGSCVNTVARKIVDPDATSPICGADWTAKTNVGPGQYLLKSVASPYNDDKVAMLVAGYEAANTVSAVAKLKEGHMTDVGTSNIYPVTSA